MCNVVQKESFKYLLLLLLLSSKGLDGDVKMLVKVANQDEFFQLLNDNWEVERVLPSGITMKK